MSKGQPAEKVRAMYELGIHEFGENYAQEMLAKAEALKDLPLRWVFLGHIQSNKIRRIVSVASEIQALDDLRHARMISEAAVALGKTPYPVYISVNAGEESQKSGVSFEGLPAFAAEIQRDLPALAVQGVMAVPPFTYSDLSFKGELPAIYRSLREASRTIGSGKLSLGMSDDLLMSVTAGSDGVRIGRALFGDRA